MLYGKFIDGKTHAILENTFRVCLPTETLARIRGMAALGSFATKLDRPRHVRFPPVSDRTADIAGGPFRANKRHSEITRFASRARMQPPVIKMAQVSGRDVS